MTNYFKSISGDHEFSGLCLLLGSYAIHVLEGDAPVVNSMLRELDSYVMGGLTVYQQVWVIHQIEEVRCFRSVF